MEARQEAPRPVMGYCDRLTYEQGQVVEVKAAGRGPVDMSVVRLHRPPDDPSSSLPLDSAVDGVPSIRVVLEPQDVYPGSYALIEDVDGLADVRAITASLYFQPTLVESDHPQTLLSTFSRDRSGGFALVLDDEGYLTVIWGRGAEAAGRLRSPTKPLERYWHVVGVSLDAASGAVVLTHRPCGAVPGQLGRWSGSARDQAIRLQSDGTVTVGAGRLPGRPLALRLPGCPSEGSGFNGKIESPALFRTAVDESSLGSLRPDGSGAETGGLLARWDFARQQIGLSVADVGDHGHDGVLVNTPARAVTGVSWDGGVHDWTRAPDQYAAIHFHDDDLDDCLWPVVASVELPADLRSGVYGIRLQEADGHSEQDTIPIIVGPSVANEGQADVLVVLPSFTYIAYANILGNGEKLDYIASGLAAGEAKAYPEHKRLEEFEAIGGSIYDVHSDGSGRMYSSPRRPLLNCRPTWKSGRRDAYRHLGADLYIVSWLDSLGVSCDVVTDHTVHAAGKALLDKYSVVLTGSHPEYISNAIRKSYVAYLEGGGSLLYLGGNGFYWVTSETDFVPEGVEVRRGMTGTRTWTSAPGECYHSSTGELGGLWKFRGSPPNSLVGVGLSAQGADGGAAAYERNEASYAGPGAFLFDGVESKVIGEVGYDMGAAAGDEVDRFDVANGSPPWGVVVGSSQELSKYYKLAIEEIQMTRENTGGDYEKGVRSDLVLLEQESGGFVFSVGSISWVQSMAVDDFDTDTARVTENALRAALARRTL